jgi:tRNA pseudouridine38-40 synthase
MRWALLIEYDGAGFAGWQRQGALITVQLVLEEAAARLNGGAAVASTVAGRTDSGVHAAGQVALIALPRLTTGRQVRDALNFHMKPHRVSVLAAMAAPAEWNPRFSAVHRVYRYRILNRPARPALQAGQVWHLPRRLDEAGMQRAAARLLGKHDFTSFRAAACQANSPLRTLDRLEVTRDGDLISIWAEARSFLHHQVRNMVGTLKLVGEGHWSEADVARALAARSRAAAGPTAPAEGLCLMRVDYPRNPFSPPDLPSPTED